MVIGDVAAYIPQRRSACIVAVERRESREPGAFNCRSNDKVKIAIPRTSCRRTKLSYEPSHVGRKSSVPPDWRTVGGPECFADIPPMVTRHHTFQQLRQVRDEVLLELVANIWKRSL